MNKIIQGDCLEIMKSIEDGLIDLIACDLPYDLHWQLKWDKMIPLEPLFAQYNRIIKKNGVIALTASQPFTTQLIQANIKNFKYELIWAKTSCGSFQLAKYMPMKKHENICIFYKEMPTYNPQMLEASEASKKRRKRKYNQHHVKPHGVGAIFTGVYQNKNANSDLKYPESILNIKTERKNRIHPTQKPVELFEWLIKTYTNEGDLVLDNCAGSMTTAIACINTNRNYICIEKDEEYYRLGKERVEKYVPNKSI